ncbi:hypothetical protein MXM41_04275 [Leclercia adecarboxylata]|uniref:hypothetical protein n=1 Tax=Leclercia adecarboxylata TaxID=83655 RepID=UPI002DBE7B16|nr:hypothetical protein [Leclercia adecarboxylata]MEB6378156.1 hypothetical protein [Leclercia adecarboxylata]
MDTVTIGQRIYNVLWNANARNHDRPTWVNLDELMLEINTNVKNELAEEDVIGLILNDPFRQRDFHGEIREECHLFETQFSESVLVAVRITDIPYRNPEQWGLS